MQSNLMVFMTMVLGIVHIQTFAPNQILFFLIPFKLRFTLLPNVTVFYWEKDLLLSVWKFLISVLIVLSSSMVFFNKIFVA